jgi:2-acylglycerol O-acyltransferase 2
VYDQVMNPEGSRLRAIQDFLLEKLTIALPLVHGRGIFNYSFGWLPFRHPLTMVVGEPIPVGM